MVETMAAPARERTRPVDPRLLRYARASRTFFVLIAVIGLAQTAVIVAIAWLLTRAVTGVIDGMPLPALTATLMWLLAAFAARAALLWLREWASARAAARVEAQLRAGLADAVGRLGPGWLSTRNSAQLAVTAGRGLDALDAYFGRYLPQLVLTVIATPVIVLVMWWQDWISGLTVLLTLPLIPIFMVLIGLATRTVQKRQWQTLKRLAARFSDTVHGLSTLKVFGRQGRAAASIERVTDDYRHETMRVLRVSFMSGFALEFLASISVAIIAVSIGFRLLDGSLTLAVGLFVLLLAPEAYLPLRQVGVQFHAAAEGVAATDDVFAVLDAARDVAAPTSAESATPVRAGDLVLRDVAVHYSERALPRGDSGRATGNRHRDRGTERRRKVERLRRAPRRRAVDGERDLRRCRRRAPLPRPLARVVGPAARPDRGHHRRERRARRSRSRPRAGRHGARVGDGRRPRSRCRPGRAGGGTVGRPGSAGLRRARDPSSPVGAGERDRSR